MHRLTTTHQNGLSRGHNLKVIKGIANPPGSSRAASAPLTTPSGVRPIPENRRMDAHWTAVASYLAELHISNEG